MKYFIHNLVAGLNAQLLFAWFIDRVTVVLPYCLFLKCYLIFRALR